MLLFARAVVLAANKRVRAAIKNAAEENQMAKIRNGGEVLTRCYVCDQPNRELNKLDTMKGDKATVEIVEVCEKCAVQLRRNAKRNGKGRR